MRSLEALARYPTVETLFAALDSVPRGDSRRPLVIADASGERVALPGDDLNRARSWTIPLPDIDIRSEAGLAAKGVS
jgi:hypothetical protein